MASRAAQMAVWLGVLLACECACFGSLGQTFQRLSRLRAEKEVEKLKDQDIRPPWRRPTWHLGIFFYGMANLYDVASLVLAPMSVVIVVYAARLPLVAVMARLILSVKISQQCALGIFVTAIGAGFSMVFAPKDPSSPLEEPSDFFTPPIVLYLSVSFGSWLILGWILRRSLRARRTESPEAHLVDDRPATSGMFSPAIILPLLAAWVMTAGNLFNSGLGRIPGSAWADTKWLFLAVGTLVFSVAGGLLNLFGVEHQSTHIFVPAVFGFQAFLMGLQGALFGEFAKMSDIDIIWWSLGMAGAIAGTILVSRAGDNA